MEPSTIAASTASGTAAAADTTVQLGVLDYFAHADSVGITVMVIMAVMSVASWYFILSKAILGAWMRRQGTRFVRRFWAAESLAQALLELGDQPARDPFATVIRAGIAADSHYRKHREATLGESCTHSEFITRALRNGIAEAGARLESGLTVLASVGSTAPFVGLFGTVWGIYHALAKLAQSGRASIDQVAGPVGEALIMTACGLGVAIPAVLAYNAFVRGNRVVAGQLDVLAHDLHAFLATGARMPPVPNLHDIKLGHKGKGAAA